MLDLEDVELQLRVRLDAIGPTSRAMSKDHKRRGFRFVGPTVCCAFMQATGMVNGHVATCFR